MNSTARKHVTTLLHEEARSRLLCTFPTNGSASMASSPCLSKLVSSFLEDDDCPYNDTDSECPSLGQQSEPSSDKKVVDLLEDGVFDPYKNVLLSHVIEASKALPYPRMADEDELRRKLVAFLREKGHNAGICKAQWQSAGGLTGGRYEYVDVVAGSGRRYLVDLDFAAHFVVARPTLHYSSLWGLLPRIYVGKMGEAMKRLVTMMGDAASLSFVANNMEQPPWRKTRYMVKRWFGPYNRITGPTLSECSNVGNVSCRKTNYDEVGRGRIGLRI